IQRMATGNYSTVTDFILAGLTDEPKLKLLLFLLFLCIYVATVVGNLSMITLIGFSSHLHTPMCCLLSCLPFIDLCPSTVITPKMLVNFMSEKNISYNECMTQLYFFIIFIVSECHLLTVMAYDRYVAICSPLLYNAIMSYKICAWLSGGVSIIGLVAATAQTGCILRSFFCKDNIINHYFCDLNPLLELSCYSTYACEVIILFFGVINIIFPILYILSSYFFIIASILRIQSTEGRAKAFSTCSSHLAAVAVFYGTIIFMYLKPPSSSSMTQEKVASVFYTTVIPMLNPLIYSLRNKDVKDVLKKIMRGTIFSRSM
uniref:Olfactory receptor n=1 Tax=Vombatus ursinus TaxID=29139 RepID=A0A4X2LX79_VOMUR